MGAAHITPRGRRQARRPPLAFGRAAEVRQMWLSAVLRALCGTISVMIVLGVGCVPSVTVTLTSRQLMEDSLTSRQMIEATPMKGRMNPRAPHRQPAWIMRSVTLAASRTRFSNSSVQTVAVAFTCCVRGVVRSSHATAASPRPCPMTSILSRRHRRPRRPRHPRGSPWIGHDLMCNRGAARPRQCHLRTNAAYRSRGPCTQVAVG